MPLKDIFANLYDPHNICLDEYNEDEDKTNSLFHKDPPPPTEIHSFFKNRKSGSFLNHPCTQINLLIP